MEKLNKEEIKDECQELFNIQERAKKAKWDQKGRAWPKTGRHGRCFKRITSLKKDRLEEGLTTFDIYTKSLNPS
jgi:hypothetical protein